MQVSTVRRRAVTVTVCCTCLSMDRKLFSLKNSPQLLQICSGLTLSPKDMVCFECRARLQNVLKFRDCALRAKGFLSSLALQKFNKMPNLKCLSTLAQVVVHLDDKSCIEGGLADVKEEEGGLADVKEEEGGLADVKEEVPDPLENVELVVEPMFVSTDENLKTEAYTDPEDDFESGTKPASARGSLRDETASEDDGVHVAEKQAERAVDFVERQISLEEALAYMERERRSHRFQNARYKCNECAVIFSSSERGWKSHNLLHDEAQGPFVCSVCKQRFKSKSTLSLHTAAHYKRYECQKCDLVAYDYRRMYRHYMATHDKSQRFCNKCPERFPSFAKMLQHKRTVHAAEFTCEHCSRVFSANYKLQDHMQRKHTELPLVQCDVCPSRCKGQNNLQLHIQRVHNKKPIRSPNENAYCAECDIQFKAVSQYGSHIKYHSRHVNASTFKYECDYCGKKFVQKQSLSHHIELLHLKLAKYKCDVCDQSFRTLVYRNRHKREKHTDKPRRKYSCQICGKDFKVRKSLDQHTNMHLGLRPYVCKHCDATFTYSAALYNHNRLVHLKRKYGNPKTGKPKTVSDGPRLTES